jgi:ketosteroid isomerase-like protein
VRPTRASFRRRVVAALLFASAAGSPAAGQGTQPQDSIRREVTARIDQLLAAFRRDDPLGIARIFADDATMLGPQGLRVQGRAALDSYWQARPRPQSWEIETLEVGGSLDSPWQYARSIRVNSVEGRPERSVTTFILVWKRGADGRLRIYLDLFP